MAGSRRWIIVVKLIVGLGNPGPKYERTRHNVGFHVIDELAGRWSIDVSGEKFHGRFGLGDIGGERTALLKPLTYMNLSGKSVLAAGQFYKLEASDLLVVSDDLALPPGRIRIRLSGSAGGHKGLQDIIERLGGDDWCRLRIGVGEAFGDAADYVLSRFDPDEEVLMKRVYGRAAQAVACWITDGADAAMTTFNGDVLAE